MGANLSIFGRSWLFSRKTDSNHHIGYGIWKKVMAKKWTFAIAEKFNSISGKKNYFFGHNFFQRLSSTQNFEAMAFSSLFYKEYDGLSHERKKANSGQNEASGAHGLICKIFKIFLKILLVSTIER